MENFSDDTVYFSVCVSSFVFSMHGCHALFLDSIAVMRTNTSSPIWNFYPYRSSMVQHQCPNHCRQLPNNKAIYLRICSWMFRFCIWKAVRNMCTSSATVSAVVILINSMLLKSLYDIENKFGWFEIEDGFYRNDETVSYDHRHGCIIDACSLTAIPRWIHQFSSDHWS